MSGGHLFRRALVAASGLLLGTGLLGVAWAKQPPVLVMKVEGIITPITERYVGRGVKEAEQRDARLLVIVLDTPGGLLDSTRKITQHLLNAQVPTVVYVAPRGAQAASAGTFITAAATFAVMAPGTNIGAASPVGSGGEELPQTLKSKATQDAAAEIRSIAALRGRNVEKLESTVLRALSFTAEEALKDNLVDFIAGDLPELLQQLQGREAQLKPPDGRRLALDVRDAPVQDLEMSPVEGLLKFLANPNISYLLLTLGGIGLIVELWNPGLVFPGVVGVILLILGLVALGNLPVNWAGVLLILFAVVLAVLEVHVSGFGILGVGAVVSFLLGSLFLFFHAGAPSPTMPQVRVSLWLVAPVVVVLAAGGGWVMSTVIRARRAPSGAETPTVIGALGYATTDLTPRGTVQVASEQWSAVSQDRQPIPAGEEVQVVSVDGPVLTVARVERRPETSLQADATET
ncbi:MAG: nodulation protein NfeD [Chloroflexi bacterium]|nr:nodulation protein NfeD [Chloroflexota bacterium]